MALSLIDLQKLTLPNSLLKEGLHDNSPGYSMAHSGYNFYDLVSQVILAQNGSLTHATLTNNANGTYTFTPVVGSPILIDTRAPSNPITVIGITPATITQTQHALDYLFKYTQDSFDLFGVSWIPTPYSPSAIQTLGTFAGWTITDGLSIKGALSELELAVQDSIHIADNGLTKVTGTGAGLAQSKLQLGGLLIQPTFIGTSGHPFGVIDGTVDISFGIGLLPGYAYGGANKGTYFHGAGVSGAAMSGVQKSGAAYIPFVYFEDAASGRSRLLEFDSISARLFATSTPSFRVGTSWMDNGIGDAVEYGVGYPERTYTFLTQTYFRIGCDLSISPATTAYYDFPIVDGVANQILQTDGAGTLSWVHNITDEFVTLREFTATELIIDRDGEAFFIVPSGLNGYLLDTFEWSVFTPDTGTFNITLERNGVDVPGSGIATLASAQNGSSSFTPITLSTYDRLRVNISNSAGAAPSGLTVILTIYK